MKRASARSRVPASLLNADPATPLSREDLFGVAVETMKAVLGGKISAQAGAQVAALITRCQRLLNEMGPSSAATAGALRAASKAEIAAQMVAALRDDPELCAEVVAGLGLNPNQENDRGQEADEAEGRQGREGQGLLTQLEDSPGPAEADPSGPGRSVDGPGVAAVRELLASRAA